jgi:lysophospholipid acyltransferase (LPLAT)-like uncharacterized protein
MSVEIGHSEPARSLRVPAPPRPEAVDPAVSAEVFEYADLAEYTAKQRALIAAADRAFYALISTVGPSLRWELRGGEHLDRLYRSGKLSIWNFWHNQIFYATWFWRRRGIVVMTSRSFDGEYIARFIQRFGYGASRGSSTRGGTRALISQIRALRAGFDAAFTIDGPKGPAYVAKPGPALLARKTGHAIVPVHHAGSSYWELSSWDRFRIPKPFSRGLVVVAEPFFVTPDADDAEVEAARARLQAALDDLRQKYD